MLTLETAKQKLIVHAGRSAIKTDLLNWAFDDCASENLQDAIRNLETIDCAACHAPSGLIYNHDLAKNFAENWDEIDDAVDEYKDATGEAWYPGMRGNGGNVLSYVWFAYEWYAHEMANILQSEIED